MLNRLSIKNLAIVERAEAEFGPALNVLTGETGSGKSVVIGAIDLALGAKADAASVRDGEREAVIEAEFDLSGSDRVRGRIFEILEELGIEPDEGGSLVIRRHISASGGGRIRINDCAATVSALRKLRRFLIDIHGPRSNQSVLEERFQRETLDSWGGVVLEGYRSAYEKLRSLEKRREEILADGASEDEADLLRFQIEELESASLSEEDESLPERHAAAAHAGEIIETAGEITEALGGDNSAAEILVRLQSKFSSLAGRLEAAAEWQREAGEIAERVQELSRAIADGVAGIEVDPGELDELDRRLSTVNRLKRKYGGTVAEILELLESKRRRLDDIENRDEILAGIDREISAVREELKLEGEKVTRARRKAALKLAEAVTSELRDLGFLQAKFSVALEKAPADSSGMDRIIYLFEPNPGEPSRPLADIASSGETARVMLSLKGVLSAHDPVDVVVFDEIDANIGGDVGRKVGEKMRSLSRARQVIAITHLPQSAVYAQRHLVVSKSVSRGRTRTSILTAQGDVRVLEIARMLGGETLTSVVKKHAKELLELSR